MKAPSDQSESDPTMVTAADYETHARPYIAALEAENERLRERVASLMLDEPSKTTGLYAAIDELQRRLASDDKR